MQNLVIIFIVGLIAFYLSNRVIGYFNQPSFLSSKTPRFWILAGVLFVLFDIVLQVLLLDIDLSSIVWYSIGIEVAVFTVTFLCIRKFSYQKFIVGQETTGLYG